MKKNLYVIGIILFLVALFYAELSRVSSPDYAIGKSPSAKQLFLD